MRNYQIETRLFLQFVTPMKMSFSEEASLGLINLGGKNFSVQVSCVECQVAEETFGVVAWNLRCQEQNIAYCFARMDATDSSWGTTTSDRDSFLGRGTEMGNHERKLP